MKAMWQDVIVAEATRSGSARLAGLVRPVAPGERCQTGRPDAASFRFSSLDFAGLITYCKCMGAMVAFLSRSGPATSGWQRRAYFNE
jgi:hypothetical protein